MRFQIRQLETPSKGTMAFTPVPAMAGTAMTNGQNMIYGSPGTVPVMSPAPAAMRDGSWGGKWQPSSVAPDVILPTVYVSLPNATQRLDVAMFRHVTPHPAVTFGYSARNWNYRAIIGGTTVTPSIRPFTQWNTYGRK